jgi:hypothetical protein
LGEDLEAIRGIIQDEFQRFKDDVIEPIQTDAKTCLEDRAKLWDCTTKIKQEQSSQAADVEWLKWAVRGVAMCVIGELVTIGFVIFYN